MSFPNNFGSLKGYRSATPVLIGLRGTAPEDRRSMLVPGRLAFLATQVSAVVPLRQTLGLAPFRFALARIQPLGFAAFANACASVAARLRQAFWAVPFRFASSLTQRFASAAVGASAAAWSLQAPLAARSVFRHSQSFWVALASRFALSGHTEKPELSFKHRSNPALNLVRFAHWTLRDEAAHRW